MLGDVRFQLGDFNNLDTAMSTMTALSEMTLILTGS
jgi:hypothetical protein